MQGQRHEGETNNPDDGHHQTLDGKERASISGVDRGADVAIQRHVHDRTGERADGGPDKGAEQVGAGSNAPKGQTGGSPGEKIRGFQVLPQEGHNQQGAEDGASPPQGAEGAIPQGVRMPHLLHENRDGHGEGRPKHIAARADGERVD